LDRVADRCAAVDTWHRIHYSDFYFCFFPFNNIRWGVVAPWLEVEAVEPYHRAWYGDLRMVRVGVDKKNDGSN